MQFNVGLRAVLLLFTMTGSVCAQSLTPAQMREDFLVLRDQWAPLDHSFSAEQRRAFDEALAADIARVDTLSVPDFILDVMQAAAIPRNGHTAAWVNPHTMPMRAWWFADGLYAISVAPGFEALLGARIEKLGSLSPDEALVRAAPFISGTMQRVRYLSAVYLMAPQLLRRICAVADAANVPVMLRLRDGSERTVILGSAEAPDPGDQGNPMRSAFTVLIPDPPDMKGRWLHVLDAVKPRPAIYADLVDVSMAWIGEGGKILYIRSNFVSSLDKDALDQKLLFGVLQSQVVPRRPRFVIVDLRLNNGGNFFNTILFAQALPKLMPQEGRIFVLISRATFSAALTTAAMLRGNGEGRVVFVGEPMGDGTRFWAEGGTITLPNSRIPIRYSNGFHDWGEGCSDPGTCYWPAAAFGVRGVSLEPDVRVDVTFTDYVAGRDPVLDAAVVLAK
jgi:hypothetical protein